MCLVRAQKGPASAGGKWVAMWDSPPETAIQKYPTWL